MSQVSHIHGVVRTTPPALADGAQRQVGLDQAGNAYVTLGSAMMGEDFTLNQTKTRYPGKPTRITTATTTVIASTYSHIHVVTIEVALTGTVTIYNNNAASGQIVALLPINLAAGTYVLDMDCPLGLTVVTSAADRVLISSTNA